MSSPVLGSCNVRSGRVVRTGISLQTHVAVPAARFTTAPDFRCLRLAMKSTRLRRLPDGVADPALVPWPARREPELLGFADPAAREHPGPGGLGMPRPCGVGAPLPRPTRWVWSFHHGSVPRLDRASTRVAPRAASAYVPAWRWWTETLACARLHPARRAHLPCIEPAGKAARRTLVGGHVTHGVGRRHLRQSGRE